MLNSNEPIKIIVLSNLFPTPTQPERGIFTYQTIKELAKIHPVTVVCPLPWFPVQLKNIGFFSPWRLFADVPAMLEDGPIRVYYPRYPIIPKISDAFHGVLLFLGIAPLLHRLFRDESHAVLSAHWLYPDCMSAALYKRFRNHVPLVATILGCDLNRDINQSLLAPQIRFTMRTADKIVTVSEALRNVAINEGIPPHKVITIANGVDQNLFTPLPKAQCRQQLNLGHDIRLILVVGQLVPVKDHLTFIRGMAILRGRKKYQNVHAVLVGEGFMRDEIQSAINREGLCGIVILQGQVRHEALPTWFSAADLFCLTSIREGMPNVILEALASGCPVVASSVGGIPELISLTNGCLFQSGNAEDLAIQLAVVLDSQWSSDSVRGTVKDHTWDVVARKYHEIYSALAIEQNLMSDG
ncbi:MAG: glycosyltransferase [Desulfobulbaceae bacterium]|nr:glycosyltransferase [Desulfobulbaceae bacterium]